MKVRILPQFLNDLRNALNQDFVQRALDCVIDQKGQFLSDRNDHRYTGIKDAWIRYASAGKTAYRVIYVRSKDSIILYRAGFHSVEDNLVKPIVGGEIPEIITIEVKADDAPSHFDTGHLLSTGKPLLFRHAILEMFHCGHKEIVLVSPDISFTLLLRTHYFGRFLDKAIEENTIISLITRPPSDSDIGLFQDLEERGISVFFHKTIHAKLYLFDVDPIAQGGRSVPLPRTAFLGSANLTDTGFCLDDATGNEELCYRIPLYKYDEARDYVDWLIRASDDFTRFKSTLRKR
jgi:hypothetical protein